MLSTTEVAFNPPSNNKTVMRNSPWSSCLLVKGVWGWVGSLLTHSLLLKSISLGNKRWYRQPLREFVFNIEVLLFCIAASFGSHWCNVGGTLFLLQKNHEWTICPDQVASRSSLLFAGGLSCLKTLTLGQLEFVSARQSQVNAKHLDAPCCYAKWLAFKEGSCEQKLVPPCNSPGWFAFVCL